HMKRLFLWFQDYSYLKQAIDIWEEGDGKIEELKSLARSVHLRMEDGNFPESEREEFLITIMALDSELSILEKNFSNTMSEAAHSVQNFIYWIALVAGLILILSGALLTIAIIRNTKEWNRKLYDAQNRINSIVENSGDVIYLMDLKTRKYDYMSPSVQSMLGYSADEVKKGGPEFILDKTHTDDIKRIKQRFEDLGAGNLESQININTEFRVQRKDGEYIWVNNKRSLIRDENGNPVAVVGNVREISERKKHEEEIDQSLKEKQILLQEIHHRVKNNLAIISSLLELQKDGVDDDVQEIFKETQSRIQSIALVHEKLYQSDTLAEINLSDYMSELTEVIASAYGSESRKVTLEKELDNMFINITDAVPLGLIFNELVNNSYKHAFKGRNDGVLKIKLKKDDTHCVLSVADNGNGLPHGFRIEEQQTLGMTLLTALTSQLEADINITSNGWTEFEIKFNLDHL
ncbi:MAG: sensor histidine kinase, partial [Balneolaceae bacterium]